MTPWYPCCCGASSAASTCVDGSTFYDSFATSTNTYTELGSWVTDFGYRECTSVGEAWSYRDTQMPDALGEGMAVEADFWVIGANPGLFIGMTETSAVEHRFWLKPSTDELGFGRSSEFAYTGPSITTGTITGYSSTHPINLRLEVEINSTGGYDVRYFLNSTQIHSTNSGIGSTVGCKKYGIYGTGSFQSLRHDNLRMWWLPAT